MSQDIEHCSIRTPLGVMTLSATRVALVRAEFVASPVAHAVNGEPPSTSHPVLTLAGVAVIDYFAGCDMDHIPLAPAGTAFQQKVWTALAGVPRGMTMSYREIAVCIAAPASARAVGAAIGRNPIALFIPCHRVVASDGALTGYAWGTQRKRALLALESAAMVSMQ